MPHQLVGQDTVWKQCMSLLETPCHIFLTGSAGCGKSTLVRELIRHYATVHKRPDAAIWGQTSTDECLLLGPDQDRGIQTIRGFVSLFIRQKAIESLDGDKMYRWIIVDDVDTFPQISQQALRRPMEAYSHITRFLFIGTSFEDLIPALRSRCIHITMDTVNPYAYQEEFLKVVEMPAEISAKFTDDMWSWVLNITNSNISSLIRLLRLIKDVVVNGQPLSLKLIQMLCSTPFYMDFFPLMRSLASKDKVGSITALIHIWRRGYTFEDILESLQTMHELFGRTNDINNNILIHKFLINAWTAYCKGNTSVLALQNIMWRTLDGQL
jgi:replication-associated recombination protein RarA